MNPLVQAIENNNKNQLKLLLDLGHDPNTSCFVDKLKSENKPPLMVAFERWNIEFAEILLKAGAAAGTIMKGVVIRRNFDWCRLILQYGANPNCIINDDSEGYKSRPLSYIGEMSAATPLHYFSKNNLINLIELFIKHGADVNYLLPEGKTPVFFAVIDKSFDAIKCLIKNGCSLAITDKVGKGLLHHSAMNNFAQAAELFISKGMDVNQKDKKGRTPLFDAVYNNSLEVAMLLFSNKANPEIKDKKGRTAAFCLAETNMIDETEMLALLIKKGVELDLEDSNGRSLLGALVESGKSALVEYLLQKKLRVRSEERIKNLPLITYSINKTPSLRMNLTLVKHNVQINELDSNGNTPLMVAIERKIEKIAIALIRVGVNINHCNKKGLNALQLAVQHNVVSVFKELYSHPEIDYPLSAAEVKKTTKAAVEQLSHEALEILTSKHPEVTVEAICIDKSLCYFLSKKITGMANFLIKVGIDVNIVDDNNASPMLYAAHNNLHETAKLLIENGADVNYCNDINITPLIEAAKNNATEVAVLLLENGAYIHVVDWEGFTALDHAKQRENKKLIVEIEKYLNNQ